jgi:hypothetical protein
MVERLITQTLERLPELVLIIAWWGLGAEFAPVQMVGSRPVLC